MALIVFRCQLRGENKPEAGVGKLGGVTHRGGVTGLERPRWPERALPGTSGTQVWGQWWSQVEGFKIQLGVNRVGKVSLLSKDLFVHRGGWMAGYLVHSDL